MTYIKVSNFMSIKGQHTCDNDDSSQHNTKVQVIIWGLLKGQRLHTKINQYLQTNSKENTKRDVSKKKRKLYTKQRFQKAWEMNLGRVFSAFMRFRFHMRKPLHLAISLT